MHNMVRWKTIPLWRIIAFRLLLDELIKRLHSVASYSKSIDLIQSIQQSCCNKQMMTYPRMRKTVLTPSHNLDASRTLFSVPIDVSLRDMNLAAKQTALKGSGLVSQVEFCLCQGYWLVVIFSSITVMSLCLESELYSVTIWLRNRKVWVMTDWSFGRRNIWVLDTVLVLVICSF